MWPLDGVGPSVQSFALGSPGHILAEGGWGTGIRAPWTLLRPAEPIRWRDTSFMAAVPGLGQAAQVVSSRARQVKEGEGRGWALRNRP